MQWGEGLPKKERNMCNHGNGNGGYLVSGAIALQSLDWE